MNVTFKTIVEYLEGLADQHVNISEKYRWNKTELASSIRSGVALPIALIDAPETQEEATNNASFNNHSCAITILGKNGVDTSKITSYNEQNEVLDFCQNICFELAARIKYDAALPQIAGQKNWLYGLLVKGSFHYFKVGPVFSNSYYGYRVEFNMKSKVDCNVDVAIWNDL